MMSSFVFFFVSFIFYFLFLKKTFYLKQTQKVTDSSSYLLHFIDITDVIDWSLKDLLWVDSFSVSVLIRTQNFIFLTVMNKIGLVYKLIVISRWINHYYKMFDVQFWLPSSFCFKPKNNIKLRLSEVCGCWFCVKTPLYLLLFTHDEVESGWLIKAGVEAPFEQLVVGQSWFPVRGGNISH